MKKLIFLLALSTGCQTAPVTKPVVKPQPPNKQYVLEAKDMAILCHLPPPDYYDKPTFEQRGASISAYWGIKIRSEKFKALLKPKGYRYFDRTLFKHLDKDARKCPMVVLWAHLVEPAKIEQSWLKFIEPPFEVRGLGALPKKHVRKIIKQDRTQLIKCYSDLLRKDPKTSGMVTTRFLIDAYGRVGTPVIVKSTATNKQLETCTLDYLKTRQFDRPERQGFVIVNYPFNFGT